MSWRVPEETAHYLIRKGGAEILDAVVEKTGVDGLFAAITLGQHAKALKRAGIPIQRLGAAEWVQIFDRFTDGRIPRESVPALATCMAQDGMDADAACAALGIALRGREQWLGEMDCLSMEGYNPERADNDEKRVRFLAGKAMRMLKGKAPAAEVAALLRSLISEVVR